MILHLMDEAGNYLGPKEHVRFSPLPDRYTVVAPPAEGGYAVWTGGTWELRAEPAAPPKGVPASVTRRQIITGLAVLGWITEQEAEDALSTGARPEAVDAVINSLPEGDRFSARMKWIGFQNAFRDDAMVAALATAEGKSPQEIDDFFILCASIE